MISGKYQVGIPVSALIFQGEIVRQLCVDLAGKGVLFGGKVSDSVACTVSS